MIKTVSALLLLALTACATQREEFPLDPTYAREVACGLSPVRMVGDAQRVAQWAKATHLECAP